MSSRPYYVRLHRVWVTGKKRWATVAAVGDRYPAETDAGASDIGWFVVVAPTKGEAVPILLEWLYRDRPKSMTVEELT